MNVVSKILMGSVLAMGLVGVAQAETRPEIPKPYKTKGISIDVCEASNYGAEAVEIGGLSSDMQNAPRHGKEYIYTNTFINFCEKQHVKVYEQAIKSDKVNFNKKYILKAITPTHYVAINPKTKQVFTFASAVTPTKTDTPKKASPKLSFSKNSDMVCIANKDTLLTPYTIPKGAKIFEWDATDYGNGKQTCHKFKEKVGFDPVYPVIIERPFKK